MASWKCPHCDQSMHSSWDSRDQEAVRCIHCEQIFDNPYYKESEVNIYARQGPA